MNSIKIPSWRRLAIFGLPLAFLIFVIACKNQTGSTPPDTEAGAPPYGTYYCADPDGDSTSLCSFIPHDVDDPNLPQGTQSSDVGLGYITELDTLNQPKFDMFSWQMFVALNWPANNSGQPTGNIIGNDSAMRVWEYYPTAEDVFGGGPDSCLQGNDIESKILFQTIKFTPSSEGFGGFTETDGNVLIDRNLNFVMFEVLMNPVEAKYARDSHLTTHAGQGEFLNNLRKKGDSIFTIDLPAGYYDDNSTRTGGAVGSIELKASWRLLMPEKGDDPSRYYSRMATIYVPGENRHNGRDTCFQALVGMVGLHIITKTKLLPIMVWSTFEHVDNTPPDPDQATRAVFDSAVDSTRWSFYNPRCLTCPVNKPADTSVGQQYKLKWANKPPFARDYGWIDTNGVTIDTFGAQVIRNYPIWGPTQQMNDAWRKKLAGSVWENYQLVGSQWFISGNEHLTVPPAPHLLANTSIETFIQATSNCIRCHNGAKGEFGSKTDTLRYDFSFLFGRAK